MGVSSAAQCIPIAALYHCQRFDAPDALRQPLIGPFVHGNEVKGTLLVAGAEGHQMARLPGPTCGHRRGVAPYPCPLPGCGPIWSGKESTATEPPFGR